MDQDHATLLLLGVVVTLLVIAVDRGWAQHAARVYARFVALLRDRIRKETDRA